MQELASAAIRARPGTRALRHSRALDQTDVQGWPSEVARYARRTACVTRMASGALGLVGAVPAAAAMHHATQGLTATAAGLDHALARRVPDVADVRGFLQAVGRLAGRGRAIGVLDDVDGPDAELWLTGISQYLWDRGRGHAVTLVVSAVECDGHSVLGGWCERWRSNGFATVVAPLGPLTEPDVAALAGRCDATTLAALRERGGGNLRATHNAWATWRHNGTVRRGLTGTWTLSDRHEPVPSDDPVARLWQAIDASSATEDDSGLTARALLRRRPAGSDVRRGGRRRGGGPARRHGSRDRRTPRRCGDPGAGRAVAHVHALLGSS